MLYFFFPANLMTIYVKTADNGEIFVNQAVFLSAKGYFTLL